MKKSQILAALALAFALGVVAPVVTVSDASAKVYDASEEAEKDATKALEDAIAEGKVVGGYIGNATKYGRYKSLGDDIKNADDAIESEYETQAAWMLQRATNLYVYGGSQDANLSDFNVDTTATDYVGVRAAIQDKIAEITDKLGEEGSYPTNKVESAKSARTLLRQILNNDADAISTFKATKATAIAAKIKNIDSEYEQGDKTYEQVVEDAEALPNYANYQALVAAIKEGNDVLAASTYYNVVAATNATNNIKALIAAINNGSDTPSLNPVEPSDPSEVEDEDGKGGANAPAAGALAKADATAKATVSIMAAIASVATAAFVAIRKIAASKKA